MSIGTSHVFYPLAKLNEAQHADQRLVRLIVKGKNRAENLTESLAVSIPIMGAEQVIERIDDLLPYIVGFVQDTQDKVIRDWRIEYGHESIPESAFSIDAVLEYLTNNATGERLTSAMLKAWFEEEYFEACQEWLRQLPKLQGADDSVISRHANGIRDMFAQFADVRHKFNERQLNMLENFTQSVEADTRMEQIKARIAKQQQELQDAKDSLESIF